MAELEEVLIFDLDIELAGHLSRPASMDRLRAERITDALIEDEYVASVFNWAVDFARTHRECPSEAVLLDEFPDLELEDPDTVIDDLIGRLRLRYIKNEGREAIDKLVEQYGDDPSQLVDKMYVLTRGLQEHTRRRGDVYETDDYDRAIAKYNEMVLLGQGPSLGFPELDEHFHGQRGVTYMLGPPKSMKSWFTTRAVIANVAAEARVAYFSLELPAYEADARIRCMAAGVPWWKYLKGGLSPDDKEVLEAVSEAMTEAGSYNVWHPANGERQIDMMIEQAMTIEPDVIFIDQLQYVETLSGRSVGAKNDTGDYWEVCNRLRDYSDQVPIWMVHQFNRSVMGAEEMPSMQQIKGSAAIEETATLALGLHATKDMRSSNVVEMGTLASRNYEWLAWNFNVHFNRDCAIEMAGLSE